MTQVFLKPGYSKATKAQLKLVESLGVLGSQQKVYAEEFGVVPFELFEEGLNPLIDYAKTECKEVEFVEIEGDSVEPVVIKPKEGVHYVVIVGVGASCELVIDAEKVNLCSLELYVMQDAKVKAVLLHLDNADKSFSAIRTRVEAGAKVDWYLNYFNLDLAYSFVQSWLVGVGSESNIYLISSSRNADNVDYFIGNKFDAKNCKGQILAKGVSKDSSKMAFVGEIEITLQANGTDSYLKEDVLMLDATSKIEAVPSLEIKTNDVKAGHGVSISRLNDDKLFYLTSRGISTDEARKLVLSGFLRDSFSRIEIESVVEKLESYLV
jgi:Fe-S cluster assembly scaffold protein SufB